VEEFWTPEPLFRGQTFYVLASGPSLTAEQAERVRGRPTIAVNATCPTLAPWADVWFFTDWFFFDQFRDEIATFPGLTVTLSRKAKAEMPALRRVWTERRGRFPSPPMVRQGRSSGQTAIGLGYAMGGVRAVLLGFDMRVVDGKEHHHDAYGPCDQHGMPRDPNIYGSSFLPAFAGWNDQARAAGLEIVNATPNSALREFPMVDLEDVL
jgi:hypothetical protein